MAGGAGLAGKYALAVFVEMEGGEDDLGGVEGNVDRGAVHLIASELVKMNAVLLAVHLNNLTGSALMVATNDFHFILSSHRQRACIILLPELF